MTTYRKKNNKKSLFLLFISKYHNNRNIYKWCELSHYFIYTQKETKLIK